MSNTFSRFLVWCCFLLLAAGVGLTRAQNLDEALALYEQEDYREAIELFRRSNSYEAVLFTGKSYYALGEYVKAKTFLNRIGQEAPEDIYLEKKYTSALVDFQLRHFGSALDRLYEIDLAAPGGGIRSDARRLYREILNYLSLSQRKSVFQATGYEQVRIDLVDAALGKVDFSTAKALFGELLHVLEDTTGPGIDRLRQQVSDSLSYAYRIAFGSAYDAPRGITYHIGVTLPEFDNESPEFAVSQGLYYGFLLAAEEFNQRNTDKKLFLHFKDSGADRQNMNAVLTGLSWNSEIDALLGPLFSEPAAGMARLAEQYGVTMLAPLANSDSLNIDNPYVYQANPNFSAHGRKMAQYAVKRLKMDTLAVLAERNSLGAASAYAFRDEAERLGAKVAYSFIEDLEAQGYEIGPYTRYFTGDSTLIDSLNYHRVDAIYAPFTGQAAPTLIDLLLIDMEAMQSNIPIMGLPEWGNVNIPDRQLRNRKIYFSESFYMNRKSPELERFRQNFQDRFGIEPNRYAMVGYDSADFLFTTLERIKNPALLKNALKNQPLYRGLINDIGFENTHVNQQVKIFRMDYEGINPVF